MTERENELMCQIEELKKYGEKLLHDLEDYEKEIKHLKQENESLKRSKYRCQAYENVLNALSGCAKRLS